MGVTGDNASNNDKMCEVLSRNPHNRFVKANRGFCKGHILNLVAHSITAVFDTVARTGRLSKKAVVERKRQKGNPPSDGFQSDSDEEESDDDGEPEDDDGDEQIEFESDTETSPVKEVGWDDRVRGDELLEMLASMSEAEILEIAGETKAVRVLLVKVRRFLVRKGWKKESATQICLGLSF